MGNSDQLVDIVRQLKVAIQQAQLKTPGIRISRADVELKTTLTGGAGVDARFQVLEVTGKYTGTEIQTLQMTLTPHPPALELMSPMSDGLVDAIAAISAGAAAAAAEAPKFDLKAARITLNIGVDRAGKVLIFVGGSVESSNYHTLTLFIGDDEAARP
jgi:hypothetical protein